MNETPSSIRVAGEDRLNNFFTQMLEELERKHFDDPKREFAVSRLKARLRKRARFGKPGLKQEAVDKFVSINQSLAGFKMSLPSDIVANARHFILTMLERYTTSQSDLNIQETLDWYHLFDLWRFGPGASNGIKGTHAAEKISQAMTCTPLCVPLVLKLRKLNPYFVLEDEKRGFGVTVVSGSRLTTVPKNEDTERTIAIEPLGNMVLQLAAGRYLEGVLRYIGLDITCQQPKNKAMAMRGSLSGELATLDLASASDMISIDLVRALFPEKWFRLLNALRSPEMELPTRESMELNMISTMGNGFTFPLMTLVICSLIYAYRARRGGPTLYISWSNTCVFGDDIILPSTEYDGFSEVLTRAGFVVNFDKSYSAGPFRESCGGDYYEGYDVTPFYVKSLANDSDVYVAINQVFEWCARHNCLLPQTLMLLKTYLRRQVLFVPEWHSPDEGLLTSLVDKKYKFLQRKHIYRALSEDSAFKVMLAVGGYVLHRIPDRRHRNDDTLFYVPRLNKTEVRVRKSRLPKGYLDGSNPLYRDRSTTDYIAAYAALLFGSS